MEDGRKCAEAGTHELRRRGLDGRVACRGSVRTCGLVWVGKGLIAEEDGVGGMVDTNAELATAGTAHEVCLDLFGTKVVEGLDELKECSHIERAVDLGKLGEKTGKEGTREEGAVTSIRSVAGTQRGEDRCSGCAEVEWIKRGFEEVVEGLDWCWREAEDVSRKLDGINGGEWQERKYAYSVLEKAGAGGCLG